MKTIESMVSVLLTAVLGAGLVAAHAQTVTAFPTKPIKVVVPFTAGSGSDTSARFFGEQMGKLLGQAVVVENKPGGSGIIALQAVKMLPADGYTLALASNSPIAVNPLVMKDLPYDPVRDFKPIGGLTRGMNVLVVPNESKIRTLADLISISKTAPRGLSIATYSAGYHLAAEWLASTTGMKFVNVPYKGQAPVMTDIIGGQLDAALLDMSGAVQLLQAGKLRAVAVSGEARHPHFPDVPTIRESGFPDYVQYSWTSLYVRADTPPDVSAKLAATLKKVHASNEAREFIKISGGELMPYDADQMQTYQSNEVERFKRIAKAAGIKPE